MQSDLIIKLLNGSERYGILNQEFDPTSGHVDFFCTTEQQSDILALSEICFIKFLGKPDLADSFNEDEFFEAVTTLTGDRFHLRLKKSGNRLSQGFYGYPVEIDSDFKSIFFTTDGFKKRSHEQPLGEVLNQQGLVGKTDIDEALTEQQMLRNRRVGEILAEQAGIPQVVVEQAINNATRNGHEKIQPRVGDILIEVGLVTHQQIEEALRKQTSDKRKQIGLKLSGRFPGR